jgi:hypothetical protein
MAYFEWLLQIRSSRMTVSGAVSKLPFIYMAEFGY